MTQALTRGATTILKDNISWHFPFPAANTTPWQLEGMHPRSPWGRIRVPHLRAEQDRRDRCVQRRGPEPLCPDFPAVRNSRALQFQGRGHALGDSPPPREDARPRYDIPGRHHDPGLLRGEEHRPPPDGEMPHLHDDDRRDEECLWGSPEYQETLHAFLDPPDACGPPCHPERDPCRHLRHDGRHDRGKRTRTENDVSPSSRTTFSPAPTRSPSTPLPQK